MQRRGTGNDYSSGKGGGGGDWGYGGGKGRPPRSVAPCAGFDFASLVLPTPGVSKSRPVSVGKLDHVSLCDHNFMLDTTMVSGAPT